MNKTPKISVVIPFFNAEIFLEKVIDSVLNQSFTDFELILVNDGSTDNSFEIATRYQKKFTNINVLSIKNSGPGIARNKGVAIANGKYILFLDADDVLTPNALQILYTSIIKSNCQLVVGLHKMVDSSGEVIKELPYFEGQILNTTETIKAILNYKIIPTSWAKLYVTELVKSTPFPNLFWKEDDVFLLRYLGKINKVSCVNKVVLQNNSRANSLTRQRISTNMVTAIFTSYILQEKYIPKRLLLDFNKQQIQTLLLLFLLLSIDWKEITDKREITFILQEQTNKLLKKPDITTKNKLLLRILQSSNYLGIRFVLRLLALVKKNKINELKIIRSC